MDIEPSEVPLIKKKNIYVKSCPVTNVVYMGISLNNYLYLYASSLISELAIISY